MFGAQNIYACMHVIYKLWFKKKKNDNWFILEFIQTSLQIVFKFTYTSNMTDFRFISI